MSSHHLLTVGYAIGVSPVKKNFRTIFSEILEIVYQITF